MWLVTTAAVVNKAIAGSQGLSLSYNKLVHGMLSFCIRNFGVQSSIDSYNPTHNQLYCILLKVSPRLFSAKDMGHSGKRLSFEYAQCYLNIIWQIAFTERANKWRRRSVALSPGHSQFFNVTRRTNGRAWYTSTRAWRFTWNRLGIDLIGRGRVEGQQFWERSRS